MKARVIGKVFLKEFQATFSRVWKIEEKEGGPDRRKTFAKAQSRNEPGVT